MKKEEISHLLQRYREAVLGTSDPNPKIANKWHSKMCNFLRELRKTKEGKNGISVMIEDVDPHVKCWAATHSLEWNKTSAYAALETLRDSGGICSFDAGMVIKEYDKGKLTLC